MVYRKLVENTAYGLPAVERLCRRAKKFSHENSQTQTFFF